MVLVPQWGGQVGGGGGGGASQLCIPLPTDPNPVGDFPQPPVQDFMSLGAAAARESFGGAAVGDFSVHDIQVTQQPFFNPNGQINSQHRVQFFVGTHGPFILTFVGKEWDPNKVRQQIEQKVQELRTITGDFGGPIGRES